MTNESLMAKQRQKEEEEAKAKLKMQAEEQEYIQRSKNLPLSTYPSITGIMFDYGAGYLGREPLTFRSNYGTPFKSKAEVMGYNFRNAMNNLDSYSFNSLKDFFSEATTSPFKTLVPDPKSRGE